MAIAAVDAVVADMMFVAKRHRLATRDTDVGDVGRLINCRQRQHQDDDETGAAKNGETGNGVRARMKNLRHGPLLCRRCCQRGTPFDKNKYFSSDPPLLPTARANSPPLKPAREF